MSPDKALDLVRRYSAAGRRIRLLTRLIGNHLEKCDGLDGKRNKLEDDVFPASREIDSKGRDKSTHLWNWYQPDVVDRGYMDPGLVWQQIGAEEQAECQHCYAAHQAIQDRKEARRQFGAIKAAMTRGGAA